MSTAIAEALVQQPASLGAAFRSWQHQQHSRHSLPTKRFALLSCVCCSHLCRSLGTKAANKPALERQDLSCTYLAHHELESVSIINIIIIIIIIITIIIIIIIIIVFYFTTIIVVIITVVVIVIKQAS